MKFQEQLPTHGEYVLCLIGNKETLKRFNPPARAEVHVFAQKSEMPLFLPYTMKKHVLPDKTDEDILTVALTDFEKGVAEKEKTLFLLGLTPLYETFITENRTTLESRFCLLYND